MTNFVIRYMLINNVTFKKACEQLNINYKSVYESRRRMVNNINTTFNKLREERM